MTQAASLAPRDRAAIRALAVRMRGAGKQKLLLLTGRSAAAAAKAMTQEFGREVYRVDLSAIVGKSIGETEKNLDRVFDEAQGSSVLLFDEADVLFGKRAEVRDAHDRFANIEVSYILQRAEERRGLVIAVSQSERPLPAALRRRFIVEPFPPGTRTA